MSTLAKRVASLVALVSATVAMTPSTAGADHPLMPDLVTVKLSPKEIYVTQEGKKTLLRLANRVGNTGEGPFEVRPGEEFTDCDGDGEIGDGGELLGFQRIYQDPWVPGSTSNTFTQSQVGCVIYHPQHSHWHVASIARYSLVDESTGELTDGNKVGFCLLDSASIDGTGTPAYTRAGCGGPTAMPSVTGISPGFFDLYGPTTPGQRINITNVEPGRYCLRSRSNPDDILLESDAGNNVAELRIKLNPDRGIVKKISRNCR